MHLKLFINHITPKFDWSILVHRLRLFEVLYMYTYTWSVKIRVSIEKKKQRTNQLQKPGYRNSVMFIKVLVISTNDKNEINRNETESVFPSHRICAFAVGIQFVFIQIDGDLSLPWIQLTHSLVYSSLYGMLVALWWSPLEEDELRGIANSVADRGAIKALWPSGVCLTLEAHCGSPASRKTVPISCNGELYTVCVKPYTFAESFTLAGSQLGRSSNVIE